MKSCLKLFVHYNELFVLYSWIDFQKFLRQHFDKVVLFFMKQLLYLFLLCMVFSTHLFSTVRRGNIFQQLMFLSGVPIHEQFYNLVVRVL